MQEIEAKNLSMRMPQVRERKDSTSKLSKTCLKPTQRVMVPEINIAIYLKKSKCNKIR